MGVSPLANLSRDIDNAGRWGYRNSPITGFTIHHNAGYNAYDQATAPGREVSAQYWITDEGDILPQIDEDYRAWTSGDPNYPAGAAADSRNITVEVSNTRAGAQDGTWAISPAAQEALSALIGDCFRRHGLGPVVRGAARGVAVHRDFVPTLCPGPFIMDNLGQIIARAEQHRTGGATSPVTKPKEWYEMLKPFNGKSTRSKPQSITGDGEAKYVTFKDSHDQDAWGDRTVVRGPGHVIGLNVNLGLEGKKEDLSRAVFTLVRERGENKNRSRIAGPVRASLDTYGAVGVQLGYTGYLESGDLIRVLAQVESGRTVEVSHFYWNGETA